jgi:hypothetical protein
MSRDTITFHRHADGGLMFDTETGVFGSLGSWLVSDTQNYAPDCLDILATLEDVRARRKPMEQIEGNAYETTVTPDQVYAANMYVDDATAYTHEEAHAVVLQYWQFLEPDPREREIQVADWERSNGRAHPCRGHLD